MPSDYARVEKAVYWLQEHFRENPGLDDLARLLELSPAHTQRLFRRWAGITSNQFIQFLSVAFAKRLLDTNCILETALQSGLSGPGRLHDRMLNIEAVTPGQYRAKGREMAIDYGIAETPFGPAFLASTGRGILRLAFTDDISQETGRLQGNWPHARLRKDDAAAQELAGKVFNNIGGSGLERSSLLVRGTYFQVKVWNALLTIPSGQVVTYQTIARAIGAPRSTRAVGNAVAKNPVAFLIPCHRVIKASGALGNYHWSPVRKQAILAWESAGQVPEQYDS